MRDSTYKNYLAVWRNFNKFLIRLDKRPRLWEERVLLFCGHLVAEGTQSQTVKSYISAIKTVLKDDGYIWNENLFLIGSLTWACRLTNDVVYTRLPIKLGLLEQLLFEIQRLYSEQHYLQIMYKALFALAYFGMLRVGELVQSDHTVKAKNIHVGKNKNKILIMLYTSKTHGKANTPQEVKITGYAKLGKVRRNRMGIFVHSTLPETTCN